MRLFKYLPQKRIDVLKNQQICFTAAKNTNDAFELLPNITLASNLEGFFRDTMTSILEGRNGDALSHVIDLLKTNNIDLPKTMVKASITRENMEEAIQLIMSPLSTVLENDSELTTKLRKRWDRTIGFLCLTTDVENNEMWSRYAEEYAGFAIEFDSRNPFFYNLKAKTPLLRYPQPITYSDERPTFSIADFEKIHSNPVVSSEEFLQKTFFTKGVGSSYEKEVRIVKSLKDASSKNRYGKKIAHLFAFNPRLIKSIYIGHKSSKPFINKLVKVCAEPRYSHVSLFMQSMSQARYGFDYEIIKEGTPLPALDLGLFDLPIPEDHDLFSPLFLDGRQGGLVIGVTSKATKITAHHLGPDDWPIRSFYIEGFQFVLNTEASVKYIHRLNAIDGELGKIRKTHSYQSLIEKRLGKNPLTVLYALDNRYDGFYAHRELLLNPGQIVINKYSSLYYYDELLEMNDSTRQDRQNNNYRASNE